jgi:hypothetical protein
MGISRRGFLEVSTTIAAASATAGFPTIALAAEDAIAATPHPDVVARISVDDAKYFVGSVFLVHTSSGTFHFLCVEVKAIPPQDEISTAPGQNRFETFSMKFRPQGHTSLKQDTYTFEHPVLGRFRLFVVPSGPGVTPRHYTAIISHSASQQPLGLRDGS